MLTQPTTSTDDHAPPESAAANHHRGLRRGAVAVTATLGASATWIVGRAFDATMVIDSATGEQLDLAVVASSTLTAGLVGWAGLALLERITDRAITWWTRLGVLIIALSFIPVFTSGADGGTLAVLIAWHVTAAAVIVAGLRRTSRDVTS